jgi:hypothetical protein
MSVVGYASEGSACLREAASANRPYEACGEATGFSPWGLHPSFDKEFSVKPIPSLFEASENNPSLSYGSECPIVLTEGKRD